MLACPCARGHLSCACACAQRSEYRCGREHVCALRVSVQPAVVGAGVYMGPPERTSLAVHPLDPGLCLPRACDVRVAASPCLCEPRTECVWPLRAGSNAGVNEAFSAPGCTQGLRAAALIRLLSPRRWLPGAGHRVGALGLSSEAPRRGCFVSRTLACPDPVPSGSPGPAQPRASAAPE